MKALFALALLVSPSQAGVVMPVEYGVAPAGPSAPIVPVGAIAGGQMGAPSFGAGLLRGVLPMLPSPTPGLAGPALNFVGFSPEEAAVQPEAGSSASAPAPARSQRTAQGRSALSNPALPVKPSPGASALAISRDRRADLSTLESGLSLSRGRGGEAASRPPVEADVLERARPENAAGLGRDFFDQSEDKDRGALDASAAADRPAELGPDVSPAVGETMSGLAAAGRLAAPDAGAAIGAGHGLSRGALFGAPEETLHDAVASAPGAAAPRGALDYFRSAAPNGDVGASAVGRAPMGAAVSPSPSIPRPLALDLSGAGLIVRVRAALNGVISPAPPDASVQRLPLPGPSTALLERGAMLEAFSVARAYSEGQAAKVAAASVDGFSIPRPAPAAPPAPVTGSSPAPLWWALLALPLFAAAIRGIL